MLIYKNGRTAKGDRFEFVVEEDHFAEVGEEIDEKKYPQSEVIDLHNKLVIAPFVEPHIHLDYVYSRDPKRNLDSRGTLFSGIENWSKMKGRISTETLKANARRAIRQQISYGIQYVRTHVDVTDPELKGLRAMKEIQKEVEPYIDLQLVAFPQEGMYAFKEGEACVEEALKLGAEAVGAIPHCEHSNQLGRKSVKRVFELAEKYNCLIDIHCDEIDDPMSRFIEEMASEAIDRNCGGRVSASHTCAMGSYSPSYFFHLLDTLKKAQINFVVCPAENLHLQGRGDTSSKRRGVTRVDELMQGGLNVCFGQDSILDPWYPLGSGNLMNILDIGLHACQLTEEEKIWKALDLITVNGAKALCIPESEYGIAAGKPASFLVLDAGDAYEAICLRACVLRSVRKGKELFVRSEEPFQSCNPYLQGGSSV